jgi:predicted RNase H-like nuclease (RuvC/YqgF family)
MKMESENILNDGYLKLIADRDIEALKKQMRLLDNDVKEYRKEIREITKSLSETYRIKNALEKETQKIIEGDKK